MNKCIGILAGMMACMGLMAQSVPTPAPPQAFPVLLRNGIIHPGKGQPSMTGDLLVSEGKIAAVGVVRDIPQGCKVVDLNGQHVYPGLIACNTQLGLEEVEAVRATLDAAEVGEINPNVRAVVAFNTDSKVTPTVRSNGVLIAQIAPTGGLMAGSSSVVQLDAWSWEQATYVSDDAIHVMWPEMRIASHRFAPPAEEQRKRIKESLARLDKSVEDARAYQAAKTAGKLEQHDLRWEALIPVLRKEKPLWIHARTEKQIRSAVAFCMENDLKMVLVGGQDAMYCLDLLRGQSIPVVLFQPHSLPTSEEADVDLPYKTAGLLQKEGILVALSQDGFWQQRNLAFLAGTAAAYGLPKEEALALVTSNPAKILGIADRTGTLEPGMDANIVVSRGDLLDMRSSDVVWACIQGREIDLGNHQKDLFTKFSRRP